MTEEIKDTNVENEENLSLLETWRGIAYNSNQTKQEYDRLWANYFNLEKGIYEKILSDPENVVRGTVKELADKFGVKLLIMVGFLDGINDSLKVQNDIENMTEDTEVNLGFDTELLYKNMVEAKAEWLYNLPQWDALIDEERRKVLYKEQKASHTVVKGKKVGRNDPCPCGSGKKYKFCHGKNA